MIDVVYTLGGGSRHRDKELWYSLCSLSRYFKGVRRVFIVGRTPRCGKPPMPVTLINFCDAFPDSTTNLRCGFQLMTEADEISENFLWFNDDFLFFREFEAASFPYLTQGLLADHIARRAAWSPPTDPYDISLNLTNTLLTKSGFTPALDFEVHAPFLFNKTNLAALLAKLDWPEQGYLFRSIYGNVFSVPPVAASDCKLREAMTFPEISGRVRGMDFFSLGEGVMNHDMIVWLDRKYRELGFCT